MSNKCHSCEDYTPFMQRGHLNCGTLNEYEGDEEQGSANQSNSGVVP